VKNDLLSITPVESYTPPQIPTFADGENSAMLKKLPVRWRKNAAIFACAGIVGASVLTGCGNVRTRHDDWLHHGGAGVSPMYVVHLTEREALGVIRAQLEAAGLNFDDPPPDYVVDVMFRQMIGYGTANVDMDLFDSERSVAVVHVAAWFGGNLQIEQIGDTTVGVFQSETIEKWERTSSAERLESRELIAENLTTQVREFIEFLRAEGIL